MNFSNEFSIDPEQIVINSLQAFTHSHQKLNKQQVSVSTQTMNQIIIEKQAQQNQKKNITKQQKGLARSIEMSNVRKYGRFDK